MLSARMIGQQSYSEVDVRAVYLENLEIEQTHNISLEGEVHKHLSKVVRVKNSEKIKILNGMGLVAFGHIESVDKKETKIAIESVVKSEDNRKFNLIVGLTKKEALEEIIRKSVELGIQSIQFVETEYSQKSSLKQDRISNILESAYCQSNNPWKLEIGETIKFEELKDIINKHSSAFLMSLKEKSTMPKVNSDSLLLIGPEGGFSTEEEEALISWGCGCLKLETPIMRAPTAAVSGVGFLHCALKL